MNHRFSVPCILPLCLILLFSINLYGQSKTYYVATSGSDSNAGLNLDQPFLTLMKAVGVVVAGDTIYVRGGTFTFTGSSTINTLPAVTGASATSRCSIIGYNGERPLFDFSSMTGTSADGIKINGSYWYLKGLDIKGAPHNGLKISGGTYNIVEFCTSSENRNTGVQLAANASYNRFINCDSYYNCDASYGNADGFSPKLDVGTGNYFYGCRCWQNSDDGWDGYLRPSDDVSDTLVYCWSFMNGYLKNGTVCSGNGNGFKTGGCDVNTAGYKTLKHNMTLIHCMSFYNKAKGFDQNSNRGSVTMLNCTAFNNGSGSTTYGDLFNFAFPDTLATVAGKVLTVKNCISLGSTYGVQLSPSPTPVIVATNSWPWADTSKYPTSITTATAADFLAVDTTGVRGPRKADGSLPDVNFMHLASGSKFIDAGTNLGLAFNGTAPDLGCFESAYSTGVASYGDVKITGYRLLQNYPNPFNPTTTIRYELPQQSNVKIVVYDLMGREVALLVNGAKAAGSYTVQFNASQLASGIYFYKLNAGSFVSTKKLVLMK